MNIPAKPAATKSRRHFSWRLLPVSAIAGILATMLLPVFIMTASAAPTAINLPARGTKADLGSIGRTTAIPFSTCIASFGNMTRDAGMLTTYFSNKTNEFLSQSDQVIDRNTNITYLGTYIGGNNNSTLNQGEFDFLLNRAAMGKDQLPVIQFASAQAGAQPINGPFNPGGDCGSLVALPISQTEWRLYQIERTNAGVGSTQPYWWGTLTNPRPDGSNGTTFNFEFYGVMPGNNNTLLERRTVNFNVFGLPSWGNTGGGASPAGNLNVEWVNASEIKVVSGERNGEVYRMGRWQAHNGHSYYFLHTATGDRAGLTSGNGRMCENDPGPMPIGNNCIGGAANCVPFIEVRKAINFSRVSPGNFQPWLQSLGSGPAQLFDYNNSSECRNDKFWSITLQNPGTNSEVWFYYSKAADGFQIVFTSGDGNEEVYIGTYSKDASGLYLGGTHGCDGRIRLLDPGAVNLDRFTVEWSLLNVSEGGASCQSPQPYTSVRVGVIGGAAGDAKFQELAGIVADTGDDIGDGSRAADLVCDFSFNPLTWIMCPIIAGAQAGVEQLDNGINSMLAINVDKYFNENSTEPNSSGKGFYQAWNGVRILATAVIVIAALVMIIAQAAQWEIMSAHDFRKMLPRMLIAVIAIPICWDLCKEAVRFSEVIALGLRNIIYSPFAGQGALHIGGGTSSALALVGGAGLLTLGIFAMLSFVVTAFLAALVAFAVLVFRQAAIIFLVILAPFAIACYIMPSTQKAWKFWSGSFMAMLLMFPIIVGMIAMGRVFAFVTHRADQNNLFFQLVALVAYFLPYFMITTAFKLAGGAISAVSGFLGSATGGLSNGLRNFRSNAAKTNLGKMRTGDRFAGTNRLGRAFNATTQGVGMGWRGRFGMGRRGAGQRDIQGRAAAERAGKSEEMQQLQYDDDAIAAMYLSAGESARTAEEQLRRVNQHRDAATGNMVWNRGWNQERVNRAVSMAQSVGINKSNAIAAGNLGADNKFRSLGNPEYDGNAEYASNLISATNARLAGGGLDAGGNYVGGNQQMYDNLEGGVRWHARTHGAAHFADQTLEGAWDRTNMQELNASTPAAKQAFAGDIARRMRSTNPEVRERASVQALEMHTLLSHGTDAGSQAALQRFERDIGLDNPATNAAGAVITDPATGQPLTWRQNRSFEEYLAQNWLGRAGNYGSALRSQARTWDGQDAETLRTMGRIPGAP